MSDAVAENGKSKPTGSSLAWNIVVGGVAVAATTGIIYFLYKLGRLRTPTMAANESISKILDRLQAKNDDEMMLQKNKKKTRVKVGTRRRDGRNRGGQSKAQNTVSETPRKIPSNLAQTPAAAEGHTTISPIKNIHEYDPSVVHTPNSDEVATEGVIDEPRATATDNAAFLTPYKLPEVDDDELISMLHDMAVELENARPERQDEVESNVFFFYGSFMGSIMVMQGVYQEFGFAEYPDVLTVVKERMRENGNVSNAWYVFFDCCINACPIKLKNSNRCYSYTRLNLKATLDELDFNHIPFFKGSLTRDEIISVLYDLLRAGKSVILKINEISSSEEITRTIEVAEKFLLEKPSRENYLKFQSAVEDPNDFAIIDASISNWKNMGMLAIIDNPNGVFEEFQSQYNLKRMVEAMKPLTEVQNYLMRHYGMGGTNLSQVVAAWQGDPEVKMLKQQLNLVMRELNSE